ncbi:hypothetical protein PCA20602_02753 [Pandoraea capi]|uniref:Uncharacterized protein n=1 Tax=Pandoraea capi TaxID=2508286 RepID=A0ABY6W114_9BURK|nr:hypothetical protein [Pandoraea capi]VVE13354.1 hypothetical protein PCA20602_02753 [Pandoraea capi]
MAAILSFPYKGYRILCTAMPAPSGDYRGVAEILRVADAGAIGDGASRVSKVGGAVHSNEATAMESAAKLAKEWIDEAW